MNSETTIKTAPIESGVRPNDTDASGKSRSRQSLLFWISGLVAAVFFALSRGSAKFGVGVLLCCVFCMITDYYKPRLLYRSGKGIIFILGLICGGISAGLLFSFANVGDVDFACYTNVLWNTLHGRFLHQSFLDQNLLAIHLMPAILVFMPFYALLGNWGLLLAQTLAWTIGLWLLFSSEKSDSGASSLLVLAVATLPPIIAPLFFGFHPDTLFLPVSAGALLAFKKKSFLPFCLAVLFLPLIKEVFVLATLCFALLAFLEKRSWYWSVLPAMVSVFLIVLFWFVLSPALRSGPAHAFAMLLPSSFSGLARQLLSGNSLMYLVLSIFMVLPALLSHSIKLAFFPLPFFLFYALLPDQCFRDFWRHYALAGTWAALFSLSFCSAETLRRMTAPFLLISLCFSVLWIPLLTAPRASAEQRRAIITAVSSVTPDQKLLAHGPFIAESASRHYIMNWIYATDAWQEYDYLLFDGSYKPQWWSGRDSLDRHIRRLLGSPAWRPVLHQGSLYLFKKSL